MITVNDLKLNLSNLTNGGSCLLTRVSAVYEYKDGQRIDNLLGYRYTVVCPKNSYKDFSVKVLGRPPVVTQEMIETAESPIAVEFKNFSARFYRTPKGEYMLLAEATDAVVVDNGLDF